MIQKIGTCPLFFRGQVDPLCCPKCKGEMHVIKKILTHLGLWDMKRKPHPTASVYPPLKGLPDSGEPRPLMFFLYMKKKNNTRANMLAWAGLKYAVGGKLEDI